MNRATNRPRPTLSAPALITAVLLGPAAAAPSEDPPRMLRKESVITAPLDAVWNAWTTEEGLACISTSSNLELRLEGPYECFLDSEADARGRRGGEGARVLAFLPKEMLAFDWTFPPAVPSLRSRDARTQVVVLFDEVADGVRIRFTQHGWQEGEDWNQGFAYFDEAWDHVLRTMKSALEGKVGASG